MEEKRKYPRHRTLKSGKIVFNFKSSVIDCTIRNLSQGGACVQVASATGIPDRFDLIDASGAAWACRTAWKSETRVGVEFQ